eukprot:scaffold6552_cov115-Pinguiococcus_pyrenoidosus.AAC.1
MISIDTAKTFRLCRRSWTVLSSLSSILDGAFVSVVDPGRRFRLCRRSWTALWSPSQEGTRPNAV